MMVYSFHQGQHSAGQQPPARTRGSPLRITHALSVQCHTYYGYQFAHNIIFVIQMSIQAYSNLGNFRVSQIYA